MFHVEHASSHLRRCVSSDTVTAVNKTIYRYKTKDGERFAVHLADVADAAKCSRATAYRTARDIGNAPQPGYVWADEAADWVISRLTPYGVSIGQLPAWVQLHRTPAGPC